MGRTGSDSNLDSNKMLELCKYIRYRAKTWIIYIKNLNFIGLHYRLLSKYYIIKLETILAFLATGAAEKAYYKKIIN